MMSERAADIGRVQASHSEPMMVSPSMVSESPVMRKKDFTTALKTSPVTSRDEFFKFNSQSFVIPHPAKVDKGGEDAFFIATNGKAVGVADGVGGWSMHGIDPAIYAKSIMKDAKYAYEETDLKLPLEMLSYAYEKAKVIQGSSTACILTLVGNTLKSANIGDSGFLIIRDSHIVYRFKEQLHSFNYPFQIGTASANVPEDANTISFEMKEGDMIVMGSDGLFDNLFDGEILDIVNSHPDGLVAELLAKTAYMKSQSMHLETPFRRSACEIGLVETPFGGKLDDITVVYCKVSSKAIETSK